MQIRDGERIDFEGSTGELEFRDAREQSYTYGISIDRYLGEGTSCVCYEVTVRKDHDSSGQKRVLKFFYPDPMEAEIQVDAENMKLTIKGYERNESLQELGEKFAQAFTAQAKLANDKDCADVVVKPDLKFFDKATRYVLYENDYGTSLDLESITELREFVEKMLELASALEKIHRKNLIYMDLKPENILVSGNGHIKLLDFDAMLDLGNRSQIRLRDIRYATSLPDLIAPEIRPEQWQKFEFEQTKHFLHERVDIYSFGAIMFRYFLGRYPNSTDITTNQFRTEIEKVLKERFRRKMGKNEQEMLCDIIEKATRDDITKRYACTSNLVMDLKNLAELLVYHKQDSVKEADSRIRVAYVMDKYPLCEFRRKNEEDQEVMDVLLVGESPINRSFLANILGSAQMLETKLILRMAVLDSEETVENYLKEWPLLRKTTEIYLGNDRKVRETSEGDPVRIDDEIVDRPLAELHFYTWEKESKIRGFLETVDTRDVSWIVAGDRDLDVNKEIAEQTAEYLERAGSEEKIFIGYLDDRGDGYDLRESEKCPENMILLPFSSNIRNTPDETQFEKGIRGRAKFLHKYYTREWNEHADKEFVRKDFRRDNYNVYSSLCSILSIPYKMESVGIHERGMSGAREYREKVLGTEEKKRSPGVQERFNQMLYLEHMRWIGFMMTEGYDRPTQEQLEEYAFCGQNDQRNIKKKLHPCICRFQKGTGIVLNRLSHKMWEDPEMADIEAVLGSPLDELDQMSVRLHQWCRERTRQLMEDNRFRDVFRSLEKIMKEAKYSSEAMEMMYTWKMIHQKLLDIDSNANSLWQECCRDFSCVLAEKDSRECRERFDTIRDLTRVVLERNSYHDYKKSDQSILEVIPLLMISDDQIRTIHKPMAEKNWQNVLSSLIIEPENLILYAEDTEKAADCLELLNTFLVKERGIHYGNRDVSIKIRPMEELLNLHVTDRNQQGVLDITGLSEEMIYVLTHCKNLEKLPVICYRDGRVHSLTPGSRAEYYSTLRRHLTVKETFRLYNARTGSERSRNYMLGLSDTYDPLWKSYIQMGASRHRMLISVLRKIEEKHYYKVEGPCGDHLDQFKEQNFPADILRSTGLDVLFEKLCRDNWIEESYKIPKREQTGTIYVETRSHKLAEDLKDIFDELKAHRDQIYEHHFVYRKMYREPFSGRSLEKPVCYIYDDSFLVDEEITEEMAGLTENTVDNGEMSDWRDMLGEALDILSARADEMGNGMFIDRVFETPFFMKDAADPGKMRISFRYQNHFIKECMMKEENVLETFVYHTIRKNMFPDDVKMNEIITWDSPSDENFRKTDTVCSEIDLVCTCHMQTFFIFCRPYTPRQSLLYELKSLASEFGINGKAILITTDTSETLAARSRQMNVYYIDREMLGGENIATLAQARLEKYLGNIFAGVREWKVIE